MGVSMWCSRRLRLQLFGETAATSIVNSAFFLKPLNDEVAGGYGSSLALVLAGGIGYRCHIVVGHHAVFLFHVEFLAVGIKKFQFLYR